VEKSNPLSGGPAASSQYKADLLQCTSNIVSAYLNKNETDLRQLPQVMETVYSILSALGESETGQRGFVRLDQHFVRPSLAQSQTSIEKSITSDYIICLEDGVRLKTLKRYLFRKYRLTPEQYRIKWGLPPDYPMVAPNYAAKRSALAKKMGLGKKRPARPGRTARKKQNRIAV
jgi:predicted transcriptional regulator